MKRIFILSCLLVFSCAAFGQQIKSRNVELDDLMTLLGASGYELFSFDATEMLGERYDLVFIKKEFSAEKQIKSSNLIKVSNKRLLTEFPESQRQQMIDQGRVIDPKTQAIAHAEKFNFGFYPSGNDSTKVMQLNIPGFLVMHRVDFKLKGITVKDSDKPVFAYHARPFKIEAFKENEFIPLVLLGSAWYDERINTYRFCGESEIDPDMSSKILKDIPHYYVIGVKFVKKQ